MFDMNETLSCKGQIYQTTILSFHMLTLRYLQIKIKSYYRFLYNIVFSKTKNPAIQLMY